MKKCNKKTLIGVIITILCIIGVILIFLFNTNTTSLNGLKEIWNNTIHPTSSQNVSELVPADSTELLLYVIDTGNSDSLVIRTSDDRSMLIDTGENDDKQRIIDTLNALGITTLDALVATHPHSDHIGSMKEILESIPVRTVYMTDFSEQAQSFKSITKQIKAKNIAAVNLTEGDTFSLGDVHFTALNPQNTEYDNTNNSSIVLLAQYENTKFLFEGDAEKEAVSDMLAHNAEIMDVDVLKVGHHGSHNGTTQELLDAATPSLALITCGKDNDYGHPHKETLDLLSVENVTVLRTDKNSDIAVFSDGNEITYKTAA
ncbi:MAG: ComEC/Rec2 family competence protein [Christensenella sp.]